MIIPQNVFIFISLFIIALYIVMMIIGYNKGFLYELISLVYTGLSLGIAWLISPVLAEQFPLLNAEKLGDKFKLIVSLFPVEKVLNIAVYFLIVFLVLKLFYLFISMILKSLNKLPVIGKMNQVLGALSGIINATIITLAISMLFTLPIFKNGKEVREGTILKYINKYSNEVSSFVLQKISTDKLNLDDLDVDELRQWFSEWLSGLKNNNE